MAAFYSIIGFLTYTSIRRTEYGLRPYPASTHTRKRWRSLEQNPIAKSKHSQNG